MTVFQTFVSMAFISVVAMAQPSIALPVSDREMLWKEALATHNGWTYTYSTYTFPDRKEAEAARDLGQRSRYELREFKRQTFTLRYNELPCALRETISLLSATELSEPILHVDGKQWLFVELEGRQESSFEAETLRDEWLETFAATALPSIQALRTDPELRTRSLLNGITNPQTLKVAIDEQHLQPKDLDRVRSNGRTPLIQALFCKDIPLVKALLANGASSNRCTREDCPLSVAVSQRSLDLARLLLAHKADPNGSQKLITPLMAAAQIQDKTITKLLLKAGANPLETRPDKGPYFSKTSTLFYAPSTNPRYYCWLKQQVDKTLGRTGPYEWSAWIEQAGHRTRIQNGVVILLTRAPFTFVMDVKPGNDFRVFATEDPSLARKFREVPFHRDLAQINRVGASGPDSTYLGVSNLVMEEGELNAYVTTQELSHEPDPEWNRGTRLLEGDRFAYQVTKLLKDPMGGPREEIPMNHYKGSGLSFAVGVLPRLGQGSDFYKPAVFQVRFKP